MRITLHPHFRLHQPDWERPSTFLWLSGVVLVASAAAMYIASALL